jgi:hypothetical protein
VCRWRKTKHLLCHVKPAPKPDELPELPKPGRDGIWIQVFVSIGLIIIGALGFQYHTFGFQVSVGIWAGLLGLITTTCSDPRPRPPKYNQRGAFKFFNFFVFGAAVVFLGWHGRGITVDNQFYDKCEFNESRVINCTGYDTYELDEFVFPPEHKADIIARVTLQGFGMFFSALLIGLICGRWDKTKQLPGKDAP